MQNDMQFVQGNSDGKSFLAYDPDTGYVYNVKENSKTLICNYLLKLDSLNTNNSNKSLLAFCII